MIAKFWTLVALVVGMALAMLFLVNYDQSVVVYYWFTKDVHTAPRSLSVVLMATFVVGFLVAAIAGLADQIRLRARLRHMRRGAEKLESELATLRNLPLGEPLRGDQTQVR